MLNRKAKTVVRIPEPGRHELPRDIKRVLSVRVVQKLRGSMPTYEKALDRGFRKVVK